MMYLDGGASYNISYAQLANFIIGVVSSASFVKCAATLLAKRIGKELTGTIKNKVFNAVADNWFMIDGALYGVSRAAGNHGITLYYSTAQRIVRKSWRTYSVTCISSVDGIGFY